MNTRTQRIFASFLTVISLTTTLLPVQASAGFFDWIGNANSDVVVTVPDTTEPSWSFDTFYSQLRNDSQSTTSMLISNDSISLLGSSFDDPLAKTKKPTVHPTMIVEASGYSSTPDQTDANPFITANGTYVHDGIIAANFLPFGTLIKIPSLYGNKIFSVQDRMNKRYQQTIDIWFPDRDAANGFARKVVKIEIVSS